MVETNSTSVEPPVLMSDLATIGICSLGIAALGRRLRRRRPACKARRRAAKDPDELSHDSLQVDISNDQGARPNPVDLSAHGIAELVARVSAQEALLKMIPVRLVRFNSKEIEFVLAQKLRETLTNYRLSRSGQSIILDVEQTCLLAPTPEEVTPRPVLMPLGEGLDGSWMAIVHPGSSIAILGARAPQLLADLVELARTDPQSDSFYIRANPSGIDVVWAVEDPGESPTTAAVITTTHCDEADLTIVVDRRALTIHPYGLVIDPGESIRGDRYEAHVAHRGDVRGIQVRQSQAESPGLSPGDLEIKLLTVVPWIDGLHDVLPQKRARRATELVAYLALHHPDPISSDRLRSRVLGTPESDAAAKTLFNTVGAARRAMGLDANGAPYLPNASGYGHYRLSELVSVDVSRFARLTDLAKSAESLDESIALYRGAFELVLGEPMAGTLAGYSWWRSEGHEARLTTNVVDAASRAVHLAIEHRLLDMSTWVLDKARLIDPYSEILSRAAMATAAVSGDRARLLREWDECCRRISELDPGGRPSQETERLFVQLSRRGPNSVKYQASFAAIEEAP
jgi:DNA-binding SARP family transcriptional activator